MSGSFWGGVLLALVVVQILVIWSIRRHRDPTLKIECDFPIDELMPSLAGLTLGTAVAGNFQQGQIMETQVQMNPGKCYTVVGAAVPTVTNLDIELVPLMPVPGLASPVMAADQTTGPTAVVGAAPNCFKWALPVGGPMKVVVRVSAGSGIAAAQVFEK